MNCIEYVCSLKGLRLVHLNCRSILNKITEIGYVFSGLDVLACTETWLSKAIPNHMVAIPSMDIFRYDRDNGTVDGLSKTRGGGVACYIRNDLKLHVTVVGALTHIGSEIETLTLKCVYLFGKVFHIMVVYRPPSGSYKNFFLELSNYIEAGLLTDKELYICGDFNIDYLHRNDPKTKALINFLRSYGLKQHIETPTRLIVQSIYENYWHNLKQIATEFFSAGMHSREVSLKHTKNPLRHLWGKQVKSAIKVTFSH